MIAIESLADRIALPPPPEGWFDYAYTALTDQRLALIRTQQDIHAKFSRWWEAAQDGDPSSHGKAPGLAGDIRLSIFDGVQETDILTMPCGFFPTANRLADGRWIVVAPRARDGEENGRIYTADGQPDGQISLGDGIANLLCAPDGTIWVGYFDEGVFGYSDENGNPPVSSGGIVQFDATGTVLWSFNDQASDDLFVSDAYATTLAGNDLWTSYYSAFPIACVSDGKPRFWSNTAAGAKAIAVADDLAMLVGGYEEDRNRVVVMKLGGEDSHEIARLTYTPAIPHTAHLLQGQGDTLHLVSDGVWSRVSLHTAAQAFA